VKIKQTIALLILCCYFIFKIFSLITYDGFSTNQKYLYLLDSGHGFDGNSCRNKSVLETDGTCFYEWAYNWNVRSELALLLDEAGIKYVLINTDKSKDLDLDQRIKKINGISSKIPKILISIHGNAASDKEENFKSANGFEVYSPKHEYSKNYFYKDKKEFSDTLAKVMFDCFAEIFPDHKMRYDSRNQTYKEATYAILSKTKCYSILTENEFFTNDRIRQQMKTKEFQKRVALAHFKTIQHVEKNCNPNR
jgi:N-acetylmuramoyl-L-alanine amidase